MKHIDVLVFMEAKLGDTFPTSQFSIKGFAEPFRLDGSKNKSGVITYIGNDTSSTFLLRYVFPSDIEELYIGLNLTKSKQLHLL